MCCTFRDDIIIPSIHPPYIPCLMLIISPKRPSEPTEFQTHHSLSTPSSVPIHHSPFTTSTIYPPPTGVYHPLACSSTWPYHLLAQLVYYLIYSAHLHYLLSTSSYYLLLYVSWLWLSITVYLSQVTSEFQIIYHCFWC
jgi:hypothetical protein